MKLPQALRPVALFAALAALAGCQSLEVKQKTIDETAEVRRGPEATPQRTITGFSQALRCMDGLLLDYGVRDVTMLVEEIVDETKKVNAGTRDMLISAVSDMTRRSRAVRLVAFGKDTANVISFLASAQRQSAYEAIPLYDIKGSVTQLDENLIKNQKDLGIGFSPFVNLGIARDAASSVLGLDLSVLTTSDMAVLSGVTSRNSVVILKQGRGFDGDAAYHKFGINFSMNLSRSEGQTQALRGLVELAVVELIGRLTKTPYWSCLGASPADNEEIRLEIGDWYHSMAATRVELIGWFQAQMRRRGFYDGPIDGEFNAAFDEAIAAYREQIGLSREAVLSEQFFTAFLGADHSKVKRPAQPARYQPPPTVASAAPAVAVAPPAPAPPAPAPAAAPLTLRLATPNQQTQFARGEAISLAVQPSRDAHVYCYLQDENAKIARFYPNRFAKDSRVAATRPLLVPGAMRFQLVMNAKGVKETIACFATPDDVLDKLPVVVVGTDFEPLPVASIAQLRAAFAQASAGAFAQEILDVHAK
jgi:curli biogenesis system outer membrane secretion channel CsgG